MLDENEVRRAVMKALADMAVDRSAPAGAARPIPEAGGPGGEEDGGVLPDIAAQSISEQFFVPRPADREGYLAMKKATPARLGVWRAGPRYNTFSQLRFRADHATAQDAVFSDVDGAVVRENGFLPGQSLCTTRDEYLTRPDRGRVLDEESAARFERELPKHQKVLVMVGDGLSSAAVGANVPDLLPTLLQGLGTFGIEPGRVPFVKYCRVGAMDHVGELTGAEVVCLLIGERPGLVTDKSMSAYIAYRPTQGMPESRRTVVSNIHALGTPPVEVGAHVAELCKRILDAKASGVAFKV